MQLYKVRGGTEEELKAHQYTIGVGISLGSKWFTVENIVGLVEWSLQYSKDKVVVYVADSIHTINLEVRKGIAHEAALRKVNGMGDQILAEVKSALGKTLSQADLVRIVFAKWDSIVDDAYKKKAEYLYALYESDQDFRDTLHSVVERVVSGEERKFNEEQIHKLGTYMLEEMPEVLNRVPIAGIACDAYVYPYDGDLTRIAEHIQQGKMFPQIKEHILDTLPKVFLEVR